MNLVRYLAGLVGGLLLQACAVAQQTGVPALKVTALNGATSVLIGSLHVAADGLVQPSPSLLQGAKRYVIEGMPGPFPARFMEIAPAVKHEQPPRSLTDDLRAFVARAVREYMREPESVGVGNTFRHAVDAATEQTHRRSTGLLYRRPMKA